MRGSCQVLGGTPYNHFPVTRRTFVSTALGAASTVRAQSPPDIVDFHQHTPYSGRPADALVAHQKKLGIRTTILLPAGRSYGLAANAGGNDAVKALLDQHPKSFVRFANEVPGLPDTQAVLERTLREGAVGIGEQKFRLPCDSKPMRRIFDIAKEFDVPVLMHFEHEMYNTGFERFHKILEKYPTVNFIGHAQTWWGNIDKNHEQSVMYPSTLVTPGGWTDRYLSDYPNMYGDLSAGSGRNSMARDEDHARGFLDRHQDRLLFGSDCSDSIGQGDECIGYRTLGLLDRLVPDPAVRGKILSGNARKLLRLPAA